MTGEFGRLLRYYRRESSDPEFGGQLTHKRFGMFFQTATSIAFDPSMFSHWERGSRTINPEDRHILIGIIRVLHQCGGIPTLEQANAFLKSGNFWTLETGEIEEINADWLNAQDTKTSTLPQKLYHEFIGRTAELTAIINALNDTNQSLVIGIDGLGGMGKTALAREVLEQTQAKQFFPMTFWATAKRVQLEAQDTTFSVGKSFTYASILSDIAHQLGVSYELNQIQEISEKEERLKRFLVTSPCLIVLDNLETADENQNQIAARIQAILNPSRAILTSRHKWEQFTNVTAISLGGLPQNHSIQLMRSVAKYWRIERVLVANDNELCSLISVVGGAPLALKLLVGLLNTYDIYTLQQAVIHRSQQSIDEMYRYLFLTSWRQLQKQHKHLLFALAQFSEDIGAKAEDLKAFHVVSPRDFNDTIAYLVKLSLVEVTGDITSTRYSLHPLTLHFVRHDLLNQSQ